MNRYVIINGVSDIKEKRSLIWGGIARETWFNIKNTGKITLRKWYLTKYLLEEQGKPREEWVREVYTEETVVVKTLSLKGAGNETH